AEAAAGESTATPPAAVPTAAPPAAQPCAWLRGKGVDVVAVRKLGDKRGEYDIVLRDRRTIELGSAGDVLTPRRVQAAIADATGIVIPLLTLAKWRRIGQEILQAAQVDACGAEPLDELQGWVSSALRNRLREMDDLKAVEQAAATAGRQP